MGNSETSHSSSIIVVKWEKIMEKFMLWIRSKIKCFLAIAINFANCLAKGVAFAYTGSHSMYSETIHSAADTLNQIVLAYGINKSTQDSDTEHPYGYSNMPYVSSLVSAVAIFFMGAGLSINHGIHGLSHPQVITDTTDCYDTVGK